MPERSSEQETSNQIPGDKKDESERLSIVVPAYNEQNGIGVTLDGLRAAFPQAEIIVIDDCSKDETSAMAAQRGVRLIRHQFNRGQGASLKHGMRLARREFVAWFDADNEHRCDDLAIMFERIKANDLVAVIGQRRRSASTLRGFGKWLIRLIGRGLKISVGSDLNCGLRVFRRSVILRYLPIVPDRFSASLVTTLIMVERGYPIAFEPIETNERIGVSTVQIRDGFDAILVLMRSIMLFAPLRVFLPLGAGAVLIGTVYSLAIAMIVGVGVPLGGIALILAGLLSIMLGLIADQISQIRLAQLSEFVTMTDADDTRLPVPHE